MMRVLRSGCLEVSAAEGVFFVVPLSLKFFRIKFQRGNGEESCPVAGFMGRGSKIYGRNLISHQRHVDADTIGFRLAVHTDGVVAIQIEPTVEGALEIFAVPFGAEEFRPVAFSNSLASLGIAEGKPHL